MDREALRQILLSKGFRRTILVVLLALGTWFTVAALQLGSVADRCAGELALAVATKDRAYLSERVKNPSLVTHLLETHHAELAFVRPVDSEWSRIGLVVRSSATATVGTPLFILLSHERSQRECSFIQDYDQ